MLASESRRRRKFFHHATGVALAGVTALLANGVVAQAACSTPTTAQWNNYRWPTGSGGVVCTDGNWDSNHTFSYQSESGKWHNFAPIGAPSFAVSSPDPANCSQAVGKLWLQTTSGCTGNWIGCTQVYFDANGFISYFNLTLNNSSCFSNLSNFLAYGQCFDLDTTVGHEAGHSFGMAHNPNDSSSTMYPTQNVLPLDERSDPDCSDQNGLVAIYKS